MRCPECNGDITIEARSDGELALVCKSWTKCKWSKAIGIPSKFLTKLENWLKSQPQDVI